MVPCADALPVASAIAKTAVMSVFIGAPFCKFVFELPCGALLNTHERSGGLPFTSRRGLGAWLAQCPHSALTARVGDTSRTPRPYPAVARPIPRRSRYRVP